MRAAFLGLFLASLLALPVAAEPDLDVRVHSALLAYQAGTCDVGAWSALANDPALPSLQSSPRGSLFTALAVCDRKNQARWLSKALAEPGAPAFAYSVLFIRELYQGHLEAAVAAIENAAQRSADRSFYVPNQAITSARTALRLNHPLYRRFLTALDHAGWAPTGGYAPDYVWRDLVRFKLEDGDVASASRIAAKITYPVPLATMRVDKDFDPVVRADPKRFDVKLARDMTLDRERHRLAENPDDGEAVSALAQYLRMSGQPEEAVALTREALARAEPGHPMTSLNWVQDAYAYALEDTGRFAEAADAMVAASHQKEGGQENVSQTINAASILVAAGQPQRALDMLKVFPEARNASSYGNAWVWAERVCARMALGRGVAADDDQALDRFKDDNPDAHLQALLCEGNLEAAATRLIALLKNPDFRSDALMIVQRYPPHPRSPLDQQLSDRLRTVVARPDVAAAIQEVGRIEDIPLVPIFTFASL